MSERDEVQPVVDSRPPVSRWRTAFPPTRLALFLGVALGPTLLALFLLAVGAPHLLWSRLSGADAWEPNQVPDQARDLPGKGTYSGLTCGAGDVDWFRVQVPAGAALVVDSSPLAEERGATSIHDAQGVLLASSQPGAWEEQAVYAPPAPGPYLIRVWGRRSQYTLTVDFPVLSRRYEPNNDARSPRPLQVGLHRGLLCDGDDWYVIQVPPHLGLVAKLRGQVPQLGLELLDSARAAARSSGTLGLSAEAQAPALGAARSVKLHVSGAQAGYDLELALSADAALAPAAARLPTFPGSFEPNDSEARAQRIQPGVYPDLRTDGSDWYLVEAPDPDTTLAVTITNDPPANLGLQLMDAVSRSSQRSYDGSGSQTLQTYLPQGGSTYVSVEGEWDVHYTMTVELIHGPPGQPLLPGDYTVNGTGRDLWRVDVQPGQVLTARARFDANQGDVDLYLASADGDLDYSNGYGGSEQVSYSSPTAQPLFLRVEGTPLRYTLSIDVSTASTPKGAAPETTLQVGSYDALSVAGQASYAIALEAGQLLEVRLRLTGSERPRLGDLLDGDGLSLSPSIEVQDDGGALLRYQAPEEQLVTLMVYGGDVRRAIPFGLTVAIDGRTEPEPEVLQPGRYGGLSCPGNLVYEVAVPGGQRLVARIDFAHQDGDLDLALVDEDGAELARSATTEDFEQVEYVAPMDTTVRLRVYNALNVFDLKLELRPE